MFVCMCVGGGALLRQMVQLAVSRRWVDGWIDGWRAEASATVSMSLSAGILVERG